MTARIEARRQPMRIRRIVVPTDFSACADHARDVAVSLARDVGARVTLLHVVEPIVAGDLYGVSEAGWLDEEHRRSAKKRIAESAERLHKRGVRCQALVRDGSAAATIVETAGTAAGALIVMGTHGRSGFSRLLIGSVAEQVVRSAGCPVLTVRDSDRPGAKKPAKARFRR